MRRLRGGYEGKPSIFDEITEDDVIMAFFPCTRFETQISLWFRGESYQEKNYTDIQKLEVCMRLHEELHHFYMLISKLSIIAFKRNLKMVFENPCNQPHYLTQYWCLKPTLIDKDRTINGDWYKKPTQYWFYNFKPKGNIVFEPLEYTDIRKHSTTKAGNGTTRETERSLMHPQYADRFIRQNILDKEIWQKRG